MAACTIHSAWKYHFFSFRKTSSWQSCQWKCNFPNRPIWDLLSVSDKLESCFLGSPFRNRGSGSRLITFYSLRWPVIKKQTNSNPVCEKKNLDSGVGWGRAWQVGDESEDLDRQRRRWSSRREAGSLTESKRRTGWQADSCEGRQVCIQWHGITQATDNRSVIHRRQSSVNLYCPQGIIRKGEAGRHMGRETDRRARTDGQTHKGTVAQCTAGRSTHTPPAVIMLHAALVQLKFQFNIVTSKGVTI